MPKMQNLEYIDFPEREYENYQKRLDKNQIIYTTRVSKEVNKYLVGHTYNSVFGVLKVVYLKHGNNINKHPFLNELQEQQIFEILKYINENGYDLIGLKKC